MSSGAVSSMRRRQADQAIANYDPQVLSDARAALVAFVNTHTSLTTSEEELTQLLQSDSLSGTALPGLDADGRVQLGRLIASVLDAQPPPGYETSSNQAKANKQVSALIKTASKLSSLHLGDLTAALAEAESPYSFAVCSFEDLELGDYIGAGAFGQVTRGTYKGHDVAIKRMMGETYDEEEFEAFIGEVGLLAKLDHPGCVKFYAASVVFPNISIVTEYVSGGDLDHKLHETFDAIDGVQIMKDVASAMAYLHSKRIIHRDLKPGNILLTGDGRAKVADYGLAKVRESTYVQTKCGTPVYVAPEVIRGEPYSEKADVYSFGVLSWEVLAREEPFLEVDYESLMDMIKDIVFNKRRPGPMPATALPAVQELVHACLAHDVEARPSFASVVSVTQHW